MPEVNGLFLERIHQILPDIEIRNVELHREGLVNDILIVNRAWVIRITKTEWGEELMDQEHRLLQFLGPRLTLSVPHSEKHDKGVLVYPHIEGETFTREIWVYAPDKYQAGLSRQLGQFLCELHSIPIENLDWELPLTLAPVTWDTWVDIYDRLVQKVKPLLLPHQIEWMETLFRDALATPDFFDFDPVLIHGELVPYHILFSPEDNQLSGVIDFATAGLGDPAIDLGALIYAYGETLVSQLATQYPDYHDLLPRARFYAKAHELQWVLLGVETNEYYWFTAHLGGARDIK